jgi:hypothetical protein
VPSDGLQATPSDYLFRIGSLVGMTTIDAQVNFVADNVDRVSGDLGQRLGGKTLVICNPAAGGREQALDNLVPRPAGHQHAAWMHGLFCLCAPAPPCAVTLPRKGPLIVHSLSVNPCMWRTPDNGPCCCCCCRHGAHRPCQCSAADPQRSSQAGWVTHCVSSSGARSSTLCV